METALVVAPDVPAKDVQELVAHARANSGKINFGFGQGTLPHMLGETLRHAASIDITSVPYKGGAQAVADMLGGHIQMNFGTTATLLPLIRDGKLRALAVTGETRAKELPDVPTMAESGYPGITMHFWNGIWAPPATPEGIVQKLNFAVQEGLKQPAVVSAISRAGFDPILMDVARTRDFIAQASPRALAIARASGVKGD